MIDSLLYMGVFLSEVKGSRKSANILLHLHISNLSKYHREWKEFWVVPESIRRSLVFSSPISKMVDLFLNFAMNS